MEVGVLDALSHRVSDAVSCRSGLCPFYEFARDGDIKGKADMNIFAKKVNNETPKKLMPKLMWQPPEDGWIKINVDGSFVEATGQASSGIVIRDYLGHVLLSSWRYLFRCSSAAEAGLSLAVRWIESPAILESDS